MTNETAMSIIESVSGATDTSTPFGEAVECMRAYIHGLETDLDAHREAVRVAVVEIVAQRKAVKVHREDGVIVGVKIDRSVGLGNIKRVTDDNPILSTAIREEQAKKEQAR